MVYGFVHQSRGHVKIESALGRGTSVRIYLPRSTENRPAEPAAARPAEPHGTENILLVEDDSKVRMSVGEQPAPWAIASPRRANGPAALGVLETARIPST